jgi:hypothetical protein
MEAILQELNQDQCEASAKHAEKVVFALLHGARTLFAAEPIDLTDAGRGLLSLCYGESGKENCLENM